MKLNVKCINWNLVSPYEFIFHFWPIHHNKYLISECIVLGKLQHRCNTDNESIKRLTDYKIIRNQLYNRSQFDLPQKKLLKVGILKYSLVELQFSLILPLFPVLIWKFSEL